MASFYQSKRFTMEMLHLLGSMSLLIVLLLLYCYYYYVYYTAGQCDEKY